MSVIKEFIEKNNEERLSIAVVGDAMVDEYFSVNVSRISPEFPIPVMHSESPRPNLSLPGGAANVAYQFRDFRVDAMLVSQVDPIAANIFRESGLNLDKSNILRQAAAWNPRKRRLYNGDFPTYRWDVEVPNYGLNDTELKLESLNLSVKMDEAVRIADVVIFSDYAKGIFFQTPSLKESVRHAIENKITLVDPKRDIELWKGCTVFKPNSVEAAAISGATKWEQQCVLLKAQLGCQAVVITQGGEGVVGLAPDGYFEYRPQIVNQNPSSVIGAGDCFMSFLAMALGRGFSIQQAVEIAFEAGAMYVGQKHNQPISRRQLMMRADPIAAKIISCFDIPSVRSGKLVFTNGCFDMLHPGHIELLRFARSKGDALVVGVNTDESVARLKPGRPFQRLADRMKMLAVLDCVDYVVSFSEDTPRQLIEFIRPDVLVKGGDYKSEEIVGADIVPEVYTCPLVSGYSTTAIVEKIKAQDF